MTTCVSPESKPIVGIENNFKHVSLDRTSHPLEPLSAVEIKLASTAIAQALKDAELRFCQLTLFEPHKEIVGLWEMASKKPYIPREAFGIVLDVLTERTYEIVVRLNPPQGETRIIALVHIPGVQPNILTTEYRACEDLIRSDPVVRTALKKRGIEDPNMVNVELWSGFFSDPKQRIANPLLYLKTDENSNPYSRPIEGMEIRVDLNKMKIVEVKELFDVPIPPADYISHLSTSYNPRDPASLSRGG